MNKLDLLKLALKHYVIITKIEQYKSATESMIDQNAIKDQNKDVALADKSLWSNASYLGPKPVTSYTVFINEYTVTPEQFNIAQTLYPDQAMKYANNFKNTVFRYNLTEDEIWHMLKIIFDSNSKVGSD